MTSPTRRAAVFALADPRGNNPHGTYETADHEGRRLNAGRYETVAGFERAVERRAERPRVPDPVTMRPSLGEGPPPAPTSSSSGLVGALIFMGIGATIAYVLSRPSVVVDDEDLQDEPRRARAPRANPTPAPAAAPPVVVVQPPPQLAAPAPTPVVIDVVAQPVAKRRRHRSRVAKVAPVETATVVVPVPVVKPA